MREGEDALAVRRSGLQARHGVLNQRRLPEAVDLLSPWTEAHPDDAPVWELLAAVRLQLQDWPRGKAASRPTLDHSPGSSMP
jgi:predicted Zn-dependent protease